MDQTMNFQNIIMTLQQYWADQGCLIWQPYYTQVGAGTMNPATFLRVLGPEPWNVAYVEPSVRPDDGRFGDNPNRLQQHYQFQVVLKPDPGNPQEIYLRSLEALGINPREHDIRFVEDNWDSPALGAWGLGWEVWLDGQEITQFTYFQQAGGINLNPNSVEITYGLDRIAISLQRVSKFQDIQWSPDKKYGDVNHQGEQEHSHYYFEVADVERLRQMYNLFEEEAKAAMAHELVLPALDYLLKCSHTFNVLDTRGAIGVTERQALFGRMRDLSRSLANAYLEQRQRLEYPWLSENKSTKQFTATKTTTVRQVIPGNPVDFLLEIGTEELPVADLSSAITQLRERMPAWLEELRLEHGEIKVVGTPRRILTHVKSLMTCQPDVSRVVKGPPADRAFDASGTLTPVGLGFAKSKGIKPEALKAMEMDGGNYVVATVEEKGKPAVEVLAIALPDLLAGIKFDKSMRWNESGVSFSRPIRWLLAILDTAIVPFNYAGVQSSNVTRGLRFYQPEIKEVKDAEEYYRYMDSQGIILDPDDRKAAIRQQIKDASKEKMASSEIDGDLLDEVAGLLETPAIVTGTYDQAHLALPEHVLTTVLKKYQRFFPMIGDKGLMPVYIAFRNGDAQGLDVIREGYDHVVRARFVDAAFFIKDDLKQPLEAHLPKLGTLIFQKKLGSILDKSKRIEALVPLLAPRLGLSATELDTAERASVLCKADLATRMVVEITSLQGSMGRYYAIKSGESAEVAEAIFEHYLPRSPGDDSPKTRAGLCVGLSDRLDTLAGLFAAGLAPTSTRDPFAQRRAAIGLVQNLINWDMNFDIGEGLGLAVEKLPLTASAESIQDCLDFIIGRLRALLIEEGYRYDVVDAVLAVQGSNPAMAKRNIKSLSELIADPNWLLTLQAFSRCVRILRTQTGDHRVDPAMFIADAEKNLFKQLEQAEKGIHDPSSVMDFIAQFNTLIPAVNRFFDEVLVMDEDTRIRENRLGLLQRVAELSSASVNLSYLEGF